LIRNSFNPAHDPSMKTSSKFFFTTTFNM